MENQMPNVGDTCRPTAYRGHQEARYFAPWCDVIEQSEALVVLADVPGVDEKGVEIELEKNVLTFTAVRTGQGRSERGRTERDTGEAYRKVFQLSDGIDGKRINASVKDGVLKIVLPKAEQHRPRKIEVTSG